MQKHIFITGIAGSGKSTICNELASRNYEAYDIENIKGLFSMVDQDTGKRILNHNNDDIKSVRQSKWTCNIKKLQTLIKQAKKNPSFFCGTGSNLEELLPLFEKVILLVADPNTLRARLSNRKPGEFANTKEIQNWLLGWKEKHEEWLKEKGAIVINTDRDIHSTVSAVLQESKK